MVPKVYLLIKGAANEEWARQALAPLRVRIAGNAGCGEMMTFVTGEKSAESMRYTDSMMTFVYLPKNRFREKSRV